MIVFFLYINYSTYIILLPTSKLMDKVTSLFGFGGSVNIDIVLDPNTRKKFLTVKDKNNNKIKLPIYVGQDDISGVVSVQLKDTKKYEHLGLRVELIGYLEIFSDKSLSTDFMAMAKQLEPAGILTQNKSYPFKFPKFEKQYQTFNGIAGRVRYYLRASLNRNYNTKIVKQIDFAVQIPTPEYEHELQNTIKLEVGIQQCLHIEFEYSKSNYHLKDCVIGKVSFQLVKIKIKSMEISIVRREIFGTGQTTKTQTQNLVKFEVMDGCPAKGQVIPIRIYLTGVELTPSYKNINNRLQVKHAINLILIDEEDRRYFKQHEIFIYRRK